MIGSGLITRSRSRIPACTFDGAIDINDQTMSNVGDMTFTAGSILAAGSTNADTLLIKAGGLSGTTLITLTSGATDVIQICPTTGVLFMGDSNVTAEAEGGITTGIQIDQGAADDFFFIGKSSDVNHGTITGQADADTFVVFKKVTGDAGGFNIRAYSDGAAGGSTALLFEAVAGLNADTTKSTAALGIVNYYISQVNPATGARADVVANGDIFTVKGYTGSAWVAGLILDIDGDLWLNGGLTVGGAIEGAAQNLNDVSQIELSETDGIPVGTIKTAKVTMAHGGTLFDAVGLTDSVIIWQQPANSVLIAAKMRLETQFAATSMTDLDVTVGLAGDPDGLVETTTNLTSDGADTEYHTRGAYWDETAAMGFYFSDAAVDWVAYATAVGANLDTTSAGTMDFYFCYLEL